MSAYNTFYEDWHHLGLADLLDAATADRIPQHQQIKLSEVAAFCAWAMKIADLGCFRNRT
ncbi:hypothetical protein [Streptomyces virginiae]